MLLVAASTTHRARDQHRRDRASATDLRGARLRIQTLVSRPRPSYFRSLLQAPLWWLCSGFDEPGLGKYEIQKVG